jgi:hypothetical protein
MLMVNSTGSTKNQVNPPQRELESFGENIWIADGPQVRDMGILFTTRMTIVKLSDGAIWISSPVPVPDTILQGITALGPVTYLISGTPRHVWRLASWHKLFPNAQLWVTKPSIMTLQKDALPVTGILGDEPESSWAADLDQVVFKGNPVGTEVMFFHRKTRTLILDDLIQNFPPKEGKPLRNAFFKMVGVLSPGGVGLDIKLAFINRNLARQSLAKLLSWDFEQLIIAHGPCLRTDAKAYVRQAFRWLGS